MSHGIAEIRRTAMDPVSVASLIAGGIAGVQRAGLPIDADGRRALADAGAALSRLGDEDAAIAGYAEALAAAGARTPDDAVVTAALRGMASSIGGDSTYLPPAMSPTGSRQTGSLGLEIGTRDGAVVVVRPLPGSPAERGDLRHGDHILSIDGRPTAGLALADVVALMRGPLGSRVVIKGERAGRPLSLALRRAVIRLRNVRWGRLDRVAYLRVDSFGETSVAEMHAALAQASRQGSPLEGVVVDLRGNGGGLLQVAAAAAGDFLPLGDSIMSLRGRTTLDNAAFKGTGDLANHLPLVVLVDRHTAAGAEIVAGALQDHRRAVIMGERTSAHGIVVTTVALPETACCGSPRLGSTVRPVAPLRGPGSSRTCRFNAAPRRPRPSRRRDPTCRPCSRRSQDSPAR